MVKSIAIKILFYFTAFVLGLYFLFAAGLFVMEKTAYGGKVEMRGTRGESRAPHTITLLDRGVDSLYARLKLIQSAQKSIELEFFIFDLDESSQLVTHELIKKAQAGVDVRVLVDFSLPVFQLKPAYAQHLLSQGVKIKYYNTAPIYQFISNQHRSHRKLLIVDDHSMITGGRNIANDYFDLGKEYNFIDSDILVTGEIAKTAREGFDAYFKSDLAKDPNVKDINAKEAAKTKDFFAKHSELEELNKKVVRTAKKDIPAYACKDITLVTDPPARGEEHRLVFKAIVEIAEQAKNQIYMESPYFVLRSGGIEVLKNIRARGVKLIVLTNGLHATDAKYAVGSIFINYFKLKKLDLDLKVTNGDRSGEASEMTEARRWGLHAKRAVIDGKHVVVGTYNIDPRSANLNSELLVICKDSPDLAQAVMRSFESREKTSSYVFGEKQPDNISAIFENATVGEIAMFAATLPLANLFDFLL